MASVSKMTLKCKKYKFKSNQNKTISWGYNNLSQNKFHKKPEITALKRESITPQIRINTDAWPIEKGISLNLFVSITKHIWKQYLWKLVIRKWCFIAIYLIIMQAQWVCDWPLSALACSKSNKSQIISYFPQF